MKKRNKRGISLVLALMLAGMPIAAAGNEGRILGDINADATVDINDSLALFQHMMLPEAYPCDYSGTLDLDRNGLVDVEDALLLFQYSMLPDIFPIEWGKKTEDFSLIDEAEVFGGEKMTLSFTEKTLFASRRDAKGEGAPVSYSAWTSTARLPLDGAYGIYYSTAAHKLLMSVAFFDESGNYISGVGTDSMNNYATTVTGFVVCPENAATVSFLGFDGTEVIPRFEHSLAIRFDSEDAFLEAKKTRSFDGLKIACLGDSLTEGDYGPITSYGGRRHENYPYFLSRLTGAEVTNYGRCGASSSSYLAEHYNAGDIDISDSDVILLMLGTNKGLAGTSQYYRDYRTLVEKILADKRPDALLILITPPSATRDSSKINFGYMNNVYNSNKSVKEIAKAKGLICFDAYNQSPIQPETEDLYQSFDGLHMNAEGYLVFAEYIAETLSQYVD